MQWSERVHWVACKKCFWTKNGLTVVEEILTLAIFLQQQTSRMFEELQNKGQLNVDYLESSGQEIMIIFRNSFQDQVGQVLKGRHLNDGQANANNSGSF